MGKDVAYSVVELAREGNGYVSSSAVTAAGISRRDLSECVSSGRIVQVERGLYALPEIWEDPFFIAQYRFSKGIFSDGTSLYLHGMTDRVPFALTMTFSRNYNKSKAKEAGVICRSCKDEVLDLGVTDVKTMYGNLVRAYDLERTLCDMVRGVKTPDDQVVIPALRAYVKRPDRNLMLLHDYAAALGVEMKISSYLKVML